MMQFFRKFYLRLVFLMLAAILMGCSASQRVVKTYEGPALPENQLARLQVPEDIKIIEIDGIRQKTYLLDNLALTYSLLPGEHTIVYQYSSIWARAKRTSDAVEPRVDLIQSDLRQVRMVFQPAETYTFSFQKPSDKREAVNFANQFAAVIVDENNKKIAGDSPVSTAPARMASTIQDPVTAGNDATHSAGSKNLAAAGIGTIRPAGPNTAQAAATATQQGNIQMVAPVEAGLSRLDAIKVLWAKASAEEKKAFLRWAFQ